MLVNSAFTGFFTNRLVTGARITSAVLAIFFIAAAFKESSSRDMRAKQVNLMIRQIGHRLLLQAGDSTSRVMPVTEIKEGTFLLKFEKDFVFNHDSLMVLSKSLLPKTQFSSGYLVTVQDCKKGNIVYGFQVNNSLPDVLACSGRREPAGCYAIEFAFPDLYANLKPKEGRTNRLTESGRSDLTETDAKPDDIKTTDIEQNNDLPAAAMNAVEVGHPGSDRSKQAKYTAFNYPLMDVTYGGMLLLLGGAVLVVGLRRNAKPAPAQHENPAVLQDPSSEMPALGAFLFDVKGQRLLMNQEIVALTDKECKVLELLYKNFGELIPRETLLQEIWINEGVITGRSLDMFISKLRKKLHVDPDLRITNIHGKGYRLESVNDATALTSSESLQH